MSSQGITMLKECRIHGLVKFNECKDGDSLRLRCSKCQTDAVSNRRRKLKLLAIMYKGGCCNDCGYSTTPNALEFHHIDPKQKEFAIGAGGITRSFDRIKVELDKCLLLCANCHREEHDRIESGLYSISPMGHARMDMFYINAINT